MEGLLSIDNYSGSEIDLSKKIAAVGMTDTPLFSEISKYVPSRKAKRFEGHQWQYETMPTGDNPTGHMGGSEPAAAKSYGYSESKNHYQIIKDTYGVEGSVEYAQNAEGKEELKRQRAMAYINHGMTIENALFLANQAPVQENKGTSTAGRMGSLDHYCGVETTLELPADTSMNDDYLREFLKFGALKGVPMTHMYVNDKVRDQIDDIFKSQIRKSGDDRVLVMPHYSEIRNMAYAPKLKIVLSTKVPQGEIIGVNMPSLALVYQRLTEDYDIARTKDAVEKEVISELTLRVNSPYGVSKAKNIKV